MGLFEEVQMDLFNFLGLKTKAKTVSGEASKPNTYAGLNDLPCPVEVHRKPHKRRVSFQMLPKGCLKITANKSYSEKELFKAVLPYIDWIEAEHQTCLKHLNRHPVKIWQSGEKFLLNGLNLKMLLSPSEVKKPYIRFMSESFEYFYPELWDELAPKEKSKNLKNALLSFFKQKTSEILNERVNFWSTQMKLYPKKITYRNQKSRWGSCSSKGNINLNWKIGCFEQEIQDYVIIHELAHLVHQNHSQRFWNLVATYCPNYKATSKKLHLKDYEVDCFLQNPILYKENPRLPEQKKPEL